MALSDQLRKIHFVGIGGIGMSGLAELLLGLGHYVSGSDTKDSDTVRRLRELGASIFIGHNAENIERSSPDVLVYSSAVQPQNPEIVVAMKKHIPVIRRAEMLAEIMRLKRAIAVAGSHGKTTTTAMLGLILKKAHWDPTLIIGGRFDAIGSNAAWGAGDWLVAEADESDGSFLRLSPEYCVVTNVDSEHLDHYGSFEEAIKAFELFLDKIPFYGKAILCSDSKYLRAMGKKFNKPRLWYGFEQSADPDYLLRIRQDGPFPEVELLSRKSNFKESAFEFRLSVPGRHNALNAAGAALMALELGVSSLQVKEGLLDFRGVQRRFELKGEVLGVKVYEDYAHHPTEIRATLAAARTIFKNSKIAVVFQPHRYSRTRDCWKDFQNCFDEGDLLWTLPIYAASETKEDWAESLDEKFFFENAGASGKYCADFNVLKSAISSEIKEAKLKSGDVIFVLGAGDVYRCIPDILAHG